MRREEAMETYCTRLKGLCWACGLLLEELEAGIAVLDGDVLQGLSDVAMARSMLGGVMAMLERSAMAVGALPDRDGGR